MTRFQHLDVRTAHRARQDLKENAAFRQYRVVDLVDACLPGSWVRNLNQELP